MRFERAHAVIMAGIAAAGLVVAFAGYRLNAEHERHQEQQQIDNMLKASAPQPTTTLPNLNIKAVR
jgi:type VI protein secretion system component VasF